MIVNGGNDNNLKRKISSKVPYHSYGIETLITKKLFIYKFLLPPNTISPNGNTLEWILWRKWDNWNWRNMNIKIALKFFNQNYTNFLFSLLESIISTKQTLNGVIFNAIIKVEQYKSCQITSNYKSYLTLKEYFYKIQGGHTCHKWHHFTLLLKMM